MNKYDNIDTILSVVFSRTADGRKAPHFSSRKAWMRFRREHFRPAEPRWERKLLRYAFAAVILSGVFFSARYSGKQSIRKEFADIVIEAPYGSTTRMTLPDGSLVYLNSGSRLSYSQGFGVNDRKVELVGEGYFEIARDESRPFIMGSDAIELQVLGTKFNFSDYPDDKTAEVALLEGSVAVTSRINGGGHIKLKPNQRVTLDKNTGRMKAESMDASSSILWTEGVLFFDEEPLERIAKTLEHSYNVKVTIEGDALRRIRFYGEFARKEQTVTEVLEVLTRTGSVNYRIEDEVIILY